MMVVLVVMVVMVVIAGSRTRGRSLHGGSGCTRDPQECSSGGVAGMSCLAQHGRSPREPGQPREEVCEEEREGGA